MLRTLDDSETHVRLHFSHFKLVTLGSLFKQPCSTSVSCHVPEIRQQVIREIGTVCFTFQIWPRTWWLLLMCQVYLKRMHILLCVGRVFHRGHQGKLFGMFLKSWMSLLINHLLVQSVTTRGVSRSLSITADLPMFPFVLSVSASCILRSPLVGAHTVKFVISAWEIDPIKGQLHRVLHQLRSINLFIPIFFIFKSTFSHINITDAAFFLDQCLYEVFLYAFSFTMPL